MNCIRIAIVDDNPEVRFIIKEIVKFEKDIEVCSEAENLEEARLTIKEFRPDIVILDISLEEENGGLKFLHEIPQLNSSAKAIIVSAHNEEPYAAKSLKEGAKGYICKDKTVSCLIPAIRTVHAGNEFVSGDDGISLEQTLN